MAENERQSLGGRPDDIFQEMVDRLYIQRYPGRLDTFGHFVSDLEHRYISRQPIRRVRPAEADWNVSGSDS